MSCAWEQKCTERRACAGGYTTPGRSHKLYPYVGAVPYTTPGKSDRMYLCAHLAKRHLFRKHDVDLEKEPLAEVVPTNGVHL